MGAIFNSAIESNLAMVAGLAQGVRAKCLELGLSSERADAIELAVVEAVNNCIEHAYAELQSGLVEVEMGVNREQLVISIRDRGRSMGQGTLELAAAPDFDASDPSSFPEGGMGLFLLKQLMDDVRYESCGGVNTLTLSTDTRRT